jgi:ABC-2 type transport system permease protein
MIFALYMVILLYGQMVATNVANEKSSRAMELLITSAKPTSMMFGKVIASCMAGLLQLIAIFGTSFVCFNANKSFWDENGVVASLFDMPLHLLIFMLVFFVLGFVIYAFLFGAVGSTVSKLEDINTAVQPITLLFIAAFMVVMFSLASNKIDTPLMIICSYIPLTSPMAMFTRIAMSVVPWYEIAVSLTILVVSLIGVGVLSARIYRVGVLLYGTPPKPRALLQAIRDL